MLIYPQLYYRGHRFIHRGTSSAVKVIRFSASYRLSGSDERSVSTGTSPEIAVL